MKVGDIVAIAGCTGTVGYISRMESLSHQVVRDGWQVLRVEEHDRGALNVSIALIDCTGEPETGAIWRDDDGDLWTVNFSRPVKMGNDDEEHEGFMIYLYTVPARDDEDS